MILHRFTPPSLRPLLPALLLGLSLPLTSPAMASTTQACCSHTVSNAPVNPASTPTAV